MTGLIIGAFLLFVLFALYLGYTRAAWIVPIGAYLAVQAGGEDGVGPFVTFLAIVYGVAVLVLAVPFVRRFVVTPFIMRIVGKILPQISETERVALEAGTVWWDGELFSGAPNWARLLEAEPARLADRERAFLDGPVDELCRLTTEWDIEQRGDLSPAVWDYLKAHGFFAMIIPQEYGGLGFSAQAHSAVVAKVASRSTALAVSVMVPNSLGPAELLLHYGTEQQKHHYLPRLARAEEIPCFALTEPGAGSDAGAIESSGIVCREDIDGESVLGMRLNWDKRYITLAPVATVLGLAFRLYDPDGLLGDRDDLGITCALIPVDLDGVDVGNRHSPLGCPFMNGPTRGHDVFVSLDAIIGGAEMAGQGWKMLMQCLSVGRGISLPSLSAGGTKLCAKAVGAYATVREQFGMSVGNFEGVQEAIGRVGAFAYALESVRRVTAAAVDAGEKPSVISAIAKCYGTELLRKSVSDAMDVFGGSGISLGPKNILGSGYRTAPIGITVEGANILTRTMIIFGQGAIRCHPFAQHEINAVAERKLGDFDRAFFGHIGFVARNAARSLILGVNSTLFSSSPVIGPAAKYYYRLNRLSAAFALAADAAMGVLGGALKRRERLTGRLADALSWQYIASAALKRYHDDGQVEADLPYLEWVCQHAIFESQDALVAFVDNLPAPGFVRFALRCVLFPLGARYRRPSDALSTRVAMGLLEGREPWQRLTTGVYTPPRDEPGFGELLETLECVLEARPAEKKVREAVRGKRLERKPAATLYRRARDGGVIDEAEFGLIESAKSSRKRAIQVDEFPKKESAGNAKADAEHELKA